ncbi:MAG: T4SS-associated protein EirA [Coxiellaceae bacterium]|nr:T4SS-associated protein EirA [Coxiellaceae bacterium]
MRKATQLLFILLLFTVSQAFALVTHTPVNKEGKLVITKHPKYFLIYCPELTTLKKDPKSLKWSAPGGWDSHAQSFATKLTAFTVAQWQGINIGHVTCVYTGTPKGTFPVLMQSSNIPITPKGGKWKYNAKKHYSNCASRSIYDCPLIVEAQQPKKNPYEEAIDIKSNSTSSPSPSMEGF